MEEEKGQRPCLRSDLMLWFAIRAREWLRGGLTMAREAPPRRFDDGGERGRAGARDGARFPRAGSLRFVFVQVSTRAPMPPTPRRATHLLLHPSGLRLRHLGAHRRSRRRRGGPQQGKDTKRAFSQAAENAKSHGEPLDGGTTLSPAAAPPPRAAPAAVAPLGGAIAHSAPYPRPRKEQPGAGRGEAEGWRRRATLIKE